MRFTRQRARTLISTGRPNRTVWSGGRLEERRCLDHRRVVDAMARRRALEDCKLSVGSPKRGPLEVELKRNDLTGIKQRSVYRRRGTREDKGGWAVARDSGRFKVATVSHLESLGE